MDLNDLLRLGEALEVGRRHGHVEGVGAGRQQDERPRGQRDGRAVRGSAHVEAMLPVPAKLLDVASAVPGRNARGADLRRHLCGRVS